MAAWLAEFPQLADGPLGGAFTTGTGDPVWRQSWSAPLKGFFHSDVYRRLAPRFAERYQQLKERWADDV